MLFLVPIAILLLTAVLMIVLRVWRPDFGFHWLVATGGAFAAWLMVLFSYTMLPDSVLVLAWGPQTSYMNSIIISLDQISWPFAAALGTLLLGTLLSDVVRAYDLSWSIWASSLLVVGIGLVGIFSANLLTFILIWMAYDLVVILILLFQLEEERLRRRSVQVFFIHLMGTLCLLLAGVISASDNNSVFLEQASPMAALLIVFAAGFRFGALPIDSRLQEAPDSRRSFGTVRSLVSMGIVSSLLVRVAGAVDNVSQAGYLGSLVFSLAGLIALIYGFAWFFSKSELEGRQAWIMSFGMLIIASTMRGELNSSLSWALAAILSGGLLFLASVRSRVSRWIVMLGLIGLSTLPFTAAWSGLGLFSAPFHISLFLYGISISLLIAGFARHANNALPEPDGLERWIRVVYPIGLIVLPLIQLGLGGLYRAELGEVPLSGWIASLLILVIAGLIFYWQIRGGTIPRRVVGGVNTFLGLNWLRSFFVSAFHLLARLLKFVSSVLEGEGGVLWVLLSIVLFLAVLLITLGS